MFDLNKFMSLPPGAKAFMALTGGASILSVVAIFDYRIAVIIGIGMALLTSVLLAYHKILAKIQGKKSKELAGSIAQHGAAAPNRSAARRAVPSSTR